MLRAVIIDDERPALDELSYLLKNNSVEVIGSFQKTEGVLEFILREKPDIIFLDIEMRGVNGIDFCAKLQNSAENTAIIFVTAYPEYALEAFRVYPLDYIVKPVDEERLARTLRHVRETSAHRVDSRCGAFFIRCFGKFVISYGGDKVRLPTKKTREILAFLLCNEGSVIYRDELTHLVFGRGDSGKDANNLRVSLFRIRNAFQEAGIGKDKILIQEDLSAVIPDGVCDIVDFMRFIKNNLRITADNITQAEKIAGFVDGNLFEGIDALWVTEKNEWVMSQAEKLFINMSTFYRSVNSPDGAEAALLRLLTLNPLSEPGHHRLLNLYMRSGETLKYCCCYERYKEMTEKELNVKPPQIYEDYYEKSK